MIVFDANSEESYTEALNIHLMLEEDLDAKKIRLKPVIYLVANKIDKDPTNTDHQKLIASAAIYSHEKMIRYMEVSAMEFKRVKKLFREMLDHIRQNQILWLLDDGQDQGPEEEI